MGRSQSFFELGIDPCIFSKEFRRPKFVADWLEDVLLASVVKLPLPSIIDRAAPKNLPPKSTVHTYVTPWVWGGALDRTCLYSSRRHKANAAEVGALLCFVINLTGGL